MDIRTLFPVAQDVKIILPNGEETDITIKVVGQDSKQFREVSKKWASEIMNAERTKKFDPELYERQQLEICLACITGWAGLQEDDVEIPFSQEKAKELLAMPELSFIRDQLSGFIAERGNFFRPRQKAAEPVREEEGKA